MVTSLFVCAATTPHTHTYKYIIYICVFGPLYIYIIYRSVSPGPREEKKTFLLLLFSTHTHNVILQYYTHILYHGRVNINEQFAPGDFVTKTCVTTRKRLLVMRTRRRKDGARDPAATRNPDLTIWSHGPNLLGS